MTTESSGECTISWFVRENEEETTVTVNNGRFPVCQNSYFLNIDSNCVKLNLLRNNPGITLTVDCTDLEGSKTISLIYKNANNYYILSSEEADKVDVVVNNGCFGLGPGDTGCRKEVSLYVAWAAGLINSEINMNMYLAEKYDENSVTDNALLYLATRDMAYLPVLGNLQKADGSFERSVMETSLAVLALKDDSVTYTEEISMAVEWLKTKQKDDGSLGSVTETAIALYAAFSEEDVSGVVVDDGDEVADGEFDCGDGYCDEIAGEDVDTCPEDCVEEDYIPDDEICQVNGICETDYGENKDNCADDCYCGDGECDDVEDLEGSCPDDCEFVAGEEFCGDGVCEGSEDESNCPDDCEEIAMVTDEEETGIGTWIIVFIIIIGIAGGGYYAYKKGIFTKPKKPVSPFARPGYSFKPRPPTTPSTLKTRPIARPGLRPSFPRTTKKDDELKKSLEEAKKLLRK